MQRQLVGLAAVWFRITADDAELDQAAQNLGGRSCNGGLIPSKLNGENGATTLTVICVDRDVREAGAMAKSVEQAQVQVAPSFSELPSTVQVGQSASTGAALPAGTSEIF